MHNELLLLSIIMHQLILGRNLSSSIWLVSSSCINYDLMIGAYLAVEKSNTMILEQALCLS